MSQHVSANKSSDTQDARRDVLWKLYVEHFTQIRHYDTQRSAVTNLLAVVAAALLTFVTYDKSINREDAYLTSLIALLGLFGAAFSLKYHERVSFRASIAEEGFQELSKLITPPSSTPNKTHEPSTPDDVQNQPASILEQQKQFAIEKHKKKFSLLYDDGKLGWVKVHRLWIIFHLILALLGAFLTVKALVNPDLPKPELNSPPSPVPVSRSAQQPDGE